MTGGILMASSPLDHVFQWTYQKIPVGTSDNWFTPDGQITLVSNHIIMQIIAALVLILLIPRFVRVRDTGDVVQDLTPRGFGNFIEVICAYLRDEVARPALGEHTDRFVPYIWTAFFYILTINLLGLLPIEPFTRGLVQVVYPEAHHGFGGAATGNIWVTGTLAVCTLVMTVVNGLRYNGFNYVRHFFQGPIFIAPLIAFLEVIGLLAKCFALTVRLFANMVAGHVLLAVLLSFISISYVALGTVPAAGIGILVVLAGVAFNLLELFVAFLQAFIFTFLTALFIGQAVVIHHEHGEEHAQAEPAASH
ncbi:MAG: F0F1 ATP synthase subunit A [Planctomycetes bacterium]|nr:F0F1 ATP synthase subunit A [Planctomycetota bacterium]